MKDEIIVGIKLAFFFTIILWALTSLIALILLCFYTQDVVEVFAMHGLCISPFLSMNVLYFIEAYDRYEQKRAEYMYELRKLKNK